MRRFPAPLVALGAALLLLLPLWVRVTRGDPLAPAGFLASGQGQFGVFLAVILGILSALLLDQLLGKALRRRDEHRAILLLALANPLTLSLFTSLTPYTVAVPFALLALLRKGPPRLAFLAAATFLAPFFGLLVAFALWLSEREHALLLSALVPFVIAIPLGLVERFRLLPWESAFAEFGAPLGLSLFFLAIGALEALLRWTEARPRARYGLYLALFLLLPFSLSARILLGLCAAPLAALFAVRLLRRRWVLAAARNVTLLLIGCSFLFLLVAQMASISSQEPSAALLAVAAGAEDGLILAPPELGATLERLGRPAMLHDCSLERDGCADAETLYRSWRLEEATPILERQRIRYLLITAEMREGLVWSRDEQGLLFLLAHSDEFRLVRKEGRFELWRYDGLSAS